MIGTTHLHHVGIVVEDSQRAAEAFSALLGVTIPAPREFNPDDLRDRDVRYLGEPATGGTRAFSFTLENVVLDFLQPVGGPSPWSDFLDRHGPGGEHLAVTIEHPERVLAAFEAAGYRTVQSGNAPGGSRYGYIESIAELGLSWEILPVLPPRTPDPPIEGAPIGLGTRRISQLGVVTRDIEALAATYTELLAIEPTPLRLPATHPARNLRHRGKPSTGQSKRLWFGFDNIRLELVEPSDGPTSWGDVLEDRGRSMHHLAFEVDDFDQAMAHLQQLGYPETHYGDFAEGCYAYVDARADLATHIEVIYRTGA